MSTILEEEAAGWFGRVCAPQYGSLRECLGSETRFRRRASKTMKNLPVISLFCVQLLKETSFQAVVKHPFPWAGRHARSTLTDSLNSVTLELRTSSQLCSRVWMQRSWRGYTGTCYDLCGWVLTSLGKF